jgi:hypothetical protein
LLERLAVVRAGLRRAGFVFPLELGCFSADVEELFPGDDSSPPVL